MNSMLLFSAVSGQWNFRTTCSSFLHNVWTVCSGNLSNANDIRWRSCPSRCEIHLQRIRISGRNEFPLSLDENIIYETLVALFIKGNPLLNQFNRYTRQCVEGGLALRYWAQLKHETFREQRKI